MALNPSRIALGPKTEMGAARADAGCAVYGESVFVLGGKDARYAGHIILIIFPHIGSPFSLLPFWKSLKYVVFCIGATIGKLKPARSFPPRLNWGAGMFAGRSTAF